MCILTNYLVDNWGAKDPNVKVIAEKFSHPSRTARLAHGRNELLRRARNDAIASHQENSSYLIVLDMDEINVNTFNTTVFQYVMEATSEWDALFFNRLYFYDIWSLRYDRFNFNIWNFGSHSRTLRDIIEADIVSLLDTSKPSFFPVISAFNGLGIYKLNFTTGCHYNGSNSEVFAENTLFKKTRLTVTEDCEHVAFHKCMLASHQARLRIFSEPLVPKSSPLN